MCAQLPFDQLPFNIDYYFLSHMFSTVTIAMFQWQLHCFTMTMESLCWRISVSGIGAGLGYHYNMSWISLKSLAIMALLVSFCCSLVLNLIPVASCIALLISEQAGVARTQMRCWVSYSWFFCQASTCLQSMDKTLLYCKICLNACPKPVKPVHLTGLTGFLWSLSMKCLCISGRPVKLQHVL